MSKACIGCAHCCGRPCIIPLAILDELVAAGFPREMFRVIPQWTFGVTPLRDIGMPCPFLYLRGQWFACSLWSVPAARSYFEDQACSATPSVALCDREEELQAHLELWSEIPNITSSERWKDGK